MRHSGAVRSKDLNKSFEHEILRHLRELNLDGKRVLVAVSGGVDSVVLWHVLQLWQRALSYDLVVAHVHHGRGSARQRAFRDRCQKFVARLARSSGFSFFTNERREWPARALKSEAELRDYRWSCLEGWAHESTSDFIAVAHHRDDLLETQMLRLIRGTSARGLRAMTHQDGRKIRPLLSLSREQIELYAKSKKLTWMRDPSNEEVEALRNWLRRRWLPQLERKSPGALKSLARSLEALASSEATAEPLSDEIWSNGGLRRKTLRQLTKKQQSEAVAEYFTRLGVKNFQRTHVNEVLRRLDTGRKVTNFSLLGFSWTILPDLVRASRV